MDRNLSGNRSPLSRSWSCASLPPRRNRRDARRIGKPEKQGASWATLASMPIERWKQIPPAAWLEVGFALTGIGTTLFGCLLPSLSFVWHLDDRQAGILFAAQFTGSALGALLVRSDFFRSAL